MPAAPPTPRHLLRWIVLAVIAVLIALAIALAIHVHNLLQPQRFTTLLENNLAAIGLRLNIQAPAKPTLFPRPGVKLKAFSLTIAGSNTPVLQANGATIVVPWRALLHGDVAIERVDVEAPRVDLDELGTLLKRLPHHAGPPTLPTITTGVDMSHGTLTHNGSPLLFDLSVETGALAPGQAFRMDLSARTATGHGFSAVLATVPSTAHSGVIEFDALRFNLTEQQGMSLQLAGQGSWRGGNAFAMQLKGSVRHRSLAPPPASAPASSATAARAVVQADHIVTDRIGLDVSPAQGAVPMTVALKLDGDDVHADLHLQPTEFGHWWKRLLAAKPGPAPQPMPFTGKAEVQQLDFGWLKASGLSIEAGPDLPPASGATTAAPAAAASH
ncbi:MAG: hypothetical protein ACREPK_08115 [Rhodanobacteraceae bacterium]